jgi:hypothetical protein
LIFFFSPDDPVTILKEVEETILLILPQAGRISITKILFIIIPQLQLPNYEHRDQGSRAFCLQRECSLEIIIKFIDSNS